MGESLPFPPMHGPLAVACRSSKDRPFPKQKALLRTAEPCPIGSVPHPMHEVHCIEWIIPETQSGFRKKDLHPGEKPEAEFAVTEPILAAYEYCNLHGLWKAEV